MTKKMTIKTRILIYLREHPSTKVNELVKGIGVKYAVTSAYIARMKTDDLIKKVGYGRYSPTEKGLSHLSNIATEEEQSDKNVIKNVEKGISLDDLNLENVDTILLLKQKYGKRKLLNIIEKIRKLIE